MHVKHTLVLFIFAAIYFPLRSTGIAGGSAEQNSIDLPIHLERSSHAAIASARAFASNGRLYISGSVRRFFPIYLPPASHVDIQLIDGSGGVVAERHSDIVRADPRRERTRGGRYPYGASLPLSLARQAAAIRIIHHSQPNH